jgi:hypothetical protein
MAAGGANEESSARTETFYRWVIVAVGIVVTCIGLGSTLSLSVFLPAMSDAMGWSRTLHTPS